MQANMVRFDDVNVVVVDPAQGSRNAVINILHGQGFRSLHGGTTLGDARSQILESAPDLLISEVKLDDGDLCDFVADLRHQRLGSNPFLAVIALTAEATPAVVKQVIDAGADYLLVKPVSTGQLMQRIHALIETRKPFVVTSQYIGPERREAMNGRRSDAPRMQVPNVLKVKATGKDDHVDVGPAIAAAQVRINLLKLERNAVQVRFLVDRILDGLERPTFDTTTTAFLASLAKVSIETAERVAPTEHAHLAKSCRSLARLAEAIGATRGASDPEHPVRLRLLAQTIEGGLRTVSGTESDGMGTTTAS